MAMSELKGKIARLYCLYLWRVTMMLRSDMEGIMDIDH